MKYSSDTIGNRNRDLPSFSAVPQTTAPLTRTALKQGIMKIFMSELHEFYYVTKQMIWTLRKMYRKI